MTTQTSLRCPKCGSAHVRTNVTPPAQHVCVRCGHKWTVKGETNAEDPAIESHLARLNTDINYR